MIRLGKERDSLNVVADQTGTPTCAADLARAIMDIIVFDEENQTFPAGIYHYSNEGVCSWYDFTVKIHELARITTCRVNPVTTDRYPTKAKRPVYSVLDKTKIKETFNLRVPQWEESLEKCLNIMN
jgi:dTDP-4-dehydrorhamnose reductase